MSFMCFSIVNAALSRHQDVDAFTWLQSFLSQQQLTSFQILSKNQMELSLPDIPPGSELYQHWQHVWLSGRLLEEQQDDVSSCRVIACSSSIAAESFGIVLSMLTGSG